MISSACRLRRAARAASIVLAVGVLWVMALGPAAAQNNFGRSAATGDWGDGLWVNPSGVVGAIPASGAEVFIGGAGFPHASALANATVDLSGSRLAGSVTIGRQSGDNGTLTIQPGGALTITNALTAGSSGGSATINLNGQTISAGSYVQNGPVAINRGAGGGLQALNFTITGGSFDIQSGDAFTGQGTVGGGATVSNTVGTSLTGLSVSGSGTSYTAAAPITMGGTFSVGAGSTFHANSQITFAGASDLNYTISGVMNVNAPVTGNGSLRSFGAGAMLNINDDVSLNGFITASISGVINLNSGSISATTLSTASGGVVNVQNNVDLTGDLLLTGITTVNVFQSPNEGNGFTLQGNLSFPFSTINLSFDAGEGPGPIDYAFRWAGNHVAALTPLLGTRIVATGAPQPVSVIYDPAKYDDFTYVAFIPSILGDFDGDGDHDATDYLNLSTNLLTDVSGMAALDSYFLGDLNGDRRINGADFVAFRTFYDQVNGSEAFAAMLSSVPEPAAAWLAAMVCVACARRCGGRQVRRRRGGAKKLVAILAAFGACDMCQGALLTDFAGSYAEYRQATAKLTDFDDNGRVAGEDFIVWQRGVGATGQSNSRLGDADGNGDIDGLDLKLWATQLGASVPKIPNSATFKLYFDPAGIVSGQLRVVVDLPQVQPGQQRFSINNENGIIQPHPLYRVFEVGQPVITTALGRQRFETIVAFTARDPQNPPTAPMTLFGYQVVDEQPELGFVGTQQGFEFDPGDSITIFNPDNGQTTVFDHTQLADTFVPLDIPLLLHIDVASGAASIRNPSFAPVTITYYEIISTAGGLQSSLWTSLDDSEGGDPPGVGWEEAGGASNFGVAESHLTGSLTINPGQEINLGALYNPSLAVQNLSFSYGTLAGQFAPGAINYFSPPGGIAVPEPKTVGLAVFILVCWAAVRRALAWRSAEQGYLVCGTP